MTNIKFSKAGQNLPRHLKIKTISFKEFNQMYMPKPTWDWKSELHKKHLLIFDRKTETTRTALSEMSKFIQKVHDEAYERGKMAICKKYDIHNTDSLNCWCKPEIESFKD